MTTLPHPLVPQAQNLFGVANLHDALLEPGRVAVVSLFWLAALPIAATLSVAATLYDRLLFLRSTALRLPYLRSHLAIKTLILRRRGFETRSVWASDRTEINRK